VPTPPRPHAPTPADRAAAPPRARAARRPAAAPPALAATGLVAALWLAGAPGCGDGADPPPPPPCDQQCQDGTALRGLRETLKLAFNLTLQGKPVGAHDVTVPCVFGGSVRVYGEAQANPVQGATDVRLTYEFVDCTYLQIDSEAPENYRLTFSGSVRQEGTIAVQPTATTALLMASDSLSLAGTVSEPPLPYERPGCAVEFVQNGAAVSGTLCGREAGFEF
jgi:hypothetical protein